MAMEQFEKWFEETYPLPRTIERGPIGRDMKVACRAVYQHALEWVLIAEWNTPDELTELISKELLGNE